MNSPSVLVSIRFHTVDVLSHAVSVGRNVFQDDEALMPDAHAALRFCGNERPNSAVNTVLDRGRGCNAPFVRPPRHPRLGAG